MISKTNDLITKVSELKGLIDQLDGKTVAINIGGNANKQLDLIAGKIDALENKTIFVNVIYNNRGTPEDIAAAEQTVKRVFVGTENLPPVIQPVIEKMITPEQTAALKTQFENVVQTGTVNENTSGAVSAMDALAAAIQNVTDKMASENLNAEQSAAILSKLAYATQQVRNANTEAEDSLTTLQNDLAKAAAQQTETTQAMLSGSIALLATDKLLADMQGTVTRAATGSAGALENLAAILNAAGVDGDAFKKSVAEGTPAMLAFAMAAKNAGDNVGGIMIPLSLASFGITGLGTAIHLAVMGTFEFLAVFIPAMYAAAAAAAVMYQGAQLVETHMTNLYTATEALGPMLGTTAGDMLGLGHSLQTAQNMANPGVYELLGAALTAVKEATGPTTDGLSAFGQMGLTVEHILDQFAAKIDVELAQNMGMVHSLLSKAVQDLVEFGQILGNVGHAILDFASAMPGAAEIALRFLDMITQVVKWLSQLPPALITVVMAFEEMYRWSGLIAGAFGLLGRAIALVGTLGIPVLIKIGANVGAMAASVINGIAGMIVNFTAMGEKIGVFGEGVDSVAGKIVDSLAGAASFMTGPWGIALSLGAIAITALAIAMHGATTAAQQWVDASQKAVTSASNLQVLNVISQQMAENNQKLAQATQVMGEETANTLKTLGASAHSAADEYYSSIYYAQSGTQAFTDNQKKLASQFENVTGGAAAISNELGVNFTTALGLADLAGVNLATTTVTFGKNMSVAGQQISNLVSGFVAMDQVGGTLANSMNAINVQAGIQASDVSKVNSAWDQFLGNVTNLTGGIAGINEDLQQLGNTESNTGTRFSTFTGTTVLSTQQIAQALTTFSGTSALVWQNFNASVSQGESFLDALRTAAAAGVVPQQQFTQAAAGVVSMLLPYATQSKSAANEVSILAQQAAGPATSSVSTLKSWVDKAGGSTVNWSGLLNTLTGKLSDVTQVAQNFSGTLKQDVINAIAQAGVSTSNITALTQKYTQSLQQNGAQSPITKQYQDDLTNAMKGYGFTATDITQIEQQIISTYGKHQSAADQLAQMINSTTTPAFINWAKNGLDLSKSQAQALWANIQSNLGPMLGGLGNLTVPKAKNAFYDWAMNGLGLSRSQANKLWSELVTLQKQIDSMHGVSLSVTEHGVGSYVIQGSGSSAFAAMQGGGQKIQAAGGGVIPGYAPGHDSVLAMLSPGEGILRPEVVKALGGPKFISALNRSVAHFAAGGTAASVEPGYSGGFTGLGPWNVNNYAAFTNVMTSALESAITSATKAAQQAAMAALVYPSGSGGTIAALMQSMAASIGWTGPQWQALYNVEMAEAGFNLNARNPSSGAYGLAQFINGPGEYAQYGGNLTAAGQITAMINYIRQRYGTPEGAWAHESAYHWYDNGGFLMPGLTLAYNGTGQPEMVTPGGGSGDLHVHLNMNGKEVGKAIVPDIATLLYQKAGRNRGNANAGQYWTPGSGSQGR